MLSKIVHMGESNLIQTPESVPQAKTIEKCFHASASSKASRLVRVCGITSMNFARPLPNLRGVSGGGPRAGDGATCRKLPCVRTKPGKPHKARQNGAGEIRCTGLPRRYHRYAVPSPGSERTSLAQIKSYAKRPPPVLRGASLGTGRRTKSQMHLKDTENPRRKRLQENIRKLRRT
jgi:hypothetical protein